MPIYAYRCVDCGHAQDVLQKISDPLLKVCPACGKQTYEKQLTAAGFQLKGSGWYVTDFREGNKGKPGDAKPDESVASKDADKAQDKAGGESKPDGQVAATVASTAGQVGAASSPAASSSSAPAASAPAASAPAKVAATPAAAPRSGA